MEGDTKSSFPKDYDLLGLSTAKETLSDDVTIAPLSHFPNIPSPAVPRLKSENDVLLANPFGDQQESAEPASGCVRLLRIRFTIRDIVTQISQVLL